MPPCNTADDPSRESSATDRRHGRHFEVYLKLIAKHPEILCLLYQIRYTLEFPHLTCRLVTRPDRSVVDQLRRLVDPDRSA
jgi:hypothetical protein